MVSEQRSSTFYCDSVVAPLVIVNAATIIVTAIIVIAATLPKKKKERDRKKREREREEEEGVTTAPSPFFLPYYYRRPPSPLLLNHNRSHFQPTIPLLGHCSSRTLLTFLAGPRCSPIAAALAGPHCLLLFSATITSPPQPQPQPLLPSSDLEEAREEGEEARESSGVWRGSEGGSCGCGGEEIVAGGSSRGGRRGKVWLWLAVGSDEGYCSGRAAAFDEEAREEGDEGVAEATTKEGYGRLEATTVVVEEERRWWLGREGGHGVRRGVRQRGPARKRGRKVRRARLEQRPRRGMTDWKRLCGNGTA
ncbi:hypothetical protein BHM03_00057407 [Ensete ventricosum]|nr:hypothetical protein BHM03_00057407 [Ensete ventricosum]